MVGWVERHGIMSPLVEHWGGQLVARTTGPSHPGRERAPKHRLRVSWGVHGSRSVRQPQGPDEESRGAMGWTKVGDAGASVPGPGMGIGAQVGGLRERSRLHRREHNHSSQRPLPRGAILRVGTAGSRTDSELRGSDIVRRLRGKP